MLIFKMLLSSGLVLGLSWIAEKASPKLAAVLGGFPLGVGIILGIFAFERPGEFANLSAIHTLAGLSANMSLMSTYAILLSRFPTLPVWASSLGSVLVFGLIGFVLSLFDFTIGSALALSVMTLLATLWLFRNMPEHRIEAPLKGSFYVMAQRAAFATLCVLVITGLAETLGAKVSGILASFPLTVFPLLVILHHAYGPRPIIAMAKHFPKGMGASLTFCTVYALGMETFGGPLSVALSIGGASVYLGLLASAQKKPARR